jgi:hypothetical protein
MTRTEIEAQTSIMAYKSELEWLENQRRFVDNLLIAIELRIILIRKLIEEEQGKK